MVHKRGGPVKLLPWFFCFHSGNCLHQTSVWQAKQKNPTFSAQATALCRFTTFTVDTAKFFFLNVRPGWHGGVGIRLCMTFTSIDVTQQSVSLLFALPPKPSVRNPTTTGTTIHSSLACSLAHCASWRLQAPLCSAKWSAMINCAKNFSKGLKWSSAAGPRSAFWIF